MFSYKLYTEVYRYCNITIMSRSLKYYIIIYTTQVYVGTSYIILVNYLCAVGTPYVQYTYYII